MTNSEQTGELAKPFTAGDELYQQRAREAFPILVRQAIARKPIFYADLAAELGMPNARNLNYVLGSVGQALIEKAQLTGETIPPITCLVLNQKTKLPSNGVAWFMPEHSFTKLSASEKRSVVDAQFQNIYAYRKWETLLQEFGLPLAERNFKQHVKQARKGGYGSGGEGPEHKALKERVANNPTLIGLPKTAAKGTIEHKLPSGDVVDVLFTHKGQRIAVEIKSHISDEADLTRGLFQCVKYEAVLKAEMAADGLLQNVRVCLVTGQELPDSLVPLKTILGIETISLPLAKPTLAPIS